MPDLAQAESLLRERLAAIEHERWAHWQRWMHDQCRRNADGSLTIPAELVERWDRQIVTPYDELSDAEKESDRKQVGRYWPLLRPDAAPLTQIKRVDEKYGPFPEFSFWREVDGC